MLQPTNDTYLKGTTVHGNEDGLVAQSGLPVLIKFDIAGLIRVDQHIQTATIRLARVASANVCGTGCAACASPVSTMVSVYWNTTDWAQGSATITDSDPGASWQAAYATGPNDRSPLVATIPVPATSPTVDLAIGAAPISATPPAPWISADRSRISVQLLFDSSSTYASLEHTCSAGAPPALILQICNN